MVLQAPPSEVVSSYATLFICEGGARIVKGVVVHLLESGEGGTPGCGSPGTCSGCMILHVLLVSLLWVVDN